ncbi:MAG: CocE/NonD family hydrolase [Holophagaceae bacterium]|nr:CocE/NonD family hydrolase [Holophagaceae bacterium]
MKLSCAPFLMLPAVLAAQAPAANQVQERYTKREVLIRMRDGVRLFTSIYAPKDTSRTYPVLMQRTPYGVAPYGPDKFRRELGPSRRFMEEGFIFVFQDVRGRMMSEGSFTEMTPHKPRKAPRDVDESTDAFDTIDWLVKNLSTNGKVGLWGVSYPGFYAAAGMIDAHPALAAVSPQAPVTDIFEGDDDHHNGALFLSQAFGFQTFFGWPRPAPTQVWPPADRRFDPGTEDGYRFFLRSGSLEDLDKKFFKGEVKSWSDVVAHPNLDPYWKSRNLRPHLKDIKPAVLMVGGFFDDEDPFGPLQVDLALGRQSPRTERHLVMGPWYHGGWGVPAYRRLGNVDFGSEVSKHYQEAIEFPFFMRHLKGAPDPQLPKAMVFETGANRWERFDAWPPRESKAVALYFREDGALSLGSAAPSPGSESWISDPDRPVPYTQDVELDVSKEYVVEDQRFASRRPDVAVFQTEPLKEDLRLAGPIHARLKVSTSGTDSDWIVKVVDVYPDDAPDLAGPGKNEAGEPDKVRLGGTQQLLRAEVMRGKFRNSLEHPEPFVPGQPARVDFSLNDVCHTFKAGHRLMVQVQCTWFPLVDRNPQTFLRNGNPKAGDYRKATQRLHWGGEDGSRLVLGVLK